MRVWALCALILAVALVCTTELTNTNVNNLQHQTVDIEHVNGKVEFTIPRELTHTINDCEIQTPDGSVYELTDDLELPTIRIVPTSLTISCGVEIDISEHVLGEWVLIAKKTDIITQTNIETRLPIVIYEGTVPELSELESPTTSRNVDTVRDLPPRVVDIENSDKEIEITIEKALLHTTDKCKIQTPDGEIHELTNATNIIGVQKEISASAVSCGIVFSVSRDILGEWILIAEETNVFDGGIVDTRLPIIFQDGNEGTTTVDPSYDEIKELETKIIRTEIDDTFVVSIERGFDHETEMCQVQTPDGVLHNFGNIVNGVEELPTSESCSIRVAVLTEDLIGQWTLIAKEKKMLSGTTIKTRLPFEVVVERQVQAIPQHTVTVRENSAFHFRLMSPIDVNQTCKITPPNEEALINIATDRSAVNYCAYIITSVSKVHSGRWEIVYGNKILYKATVELTVSESTLTVDTQFLSLALHSAVNMEVGPENAVYCRIEDPSGVVVFDGFRRCIFNIDRVQSSHVGYWKMDVGLPGKVIAQAYSLYVTLEQPKSRPEVQMSLAMSHADLALTVSCSVETASSPKSCKFRDPQGQILIAEQGVGEDRYSFYGTGVRNELGKHIVDCGLKISSPSAQDLGIWRCGVETEEDSHYGFLLVVCPWLMRNETIAAMIETEPTLRPRASFIGVSSGDSAELSCTIASPIRYCYFTSGNGTAHTVSPGESNDIFEYIGSGFESGECGMRFKAVTSNDSGRWFCHTGQNNGSLTESRAEITLNVAERMSARLSLQSNGSALVTAHVIENVALDYCRFVRNDGFGFTNELVPEGYIFTGAIPLRQCEILIVRPTDVDFRSWTVATRITGQHSEITASTQSLSIAYTYPRFFALRLTLICICLGLLIVSMSLLISSKKHRRWTYARATAVRDSFRRSFRKTPPLEVNATVTSPQAA